MLRTRLEARDKIDDEASGLFLRLEVRESGAYPPRFAEPKKIGYQS